MFLKIVKFFYTRNIFIYHFLFQIKIKEVMKPFKNILIPYGNYLLVLLNNGNQIIGNNLNQLKVVKVLNSKEEIKNNENEFQKNEEKQEIEEKKLKIKDMNIIEENKEVEIEIKNDEIKPIKLLGRKKANSNQAGIHNKFCDDNLRIKCKHIILSSLMDFINKKIYDLYNGNIGQGILKKKLYIINNKQKSTTIVQYNKDFLNKTLKDIFSENITARCTNISPNFNKELIQSLMDEEDEEKKNYFNKLFNLTFRQCLNHFIEKEIIYELLGLETINLALNKYNDNLEYKQCLENSLKNFEETILKKKSRKSRALKTNNDKTKETGNIIKFS